MNKEVEHRMKTLGEVQHICRSNSQGFTDRTKLDVIHTQLSKTPYKREYKGTLCELYSKAPLESLTETPVILISSHVDVVNEIRQCFSEVLWSNALKRGTDVTLHGTYDNSITNAACVNMMKYQDLPEQVIFAFTGDEETGNCRGAREAISHLTASLGYRKENITVLVTDVTYEGMKQGVDFTVENASCKDVTRCVPSYLMDTNQKFLYVPHGYFYFKDKEESKDIILHSHILPPSYISPSVCMFDEGNVYTGRGVETYSCCIPVGGGGMHSQTGVYTTLDTFLNYEETLSRVASEYILYRDKDREPSIDEEWEEGEEMEVS